MGRDGALMFLVLSVLVAVGTIRVCRAGDLVPNFYNTSCPNAESIVKRIVKFRAITDLPLGSKLLRMHFHDCFVRGCDGSVLLDAVGSSETEKDALPNQSLSRFEVIDEIKSELERVCPGIVSCADILALAARDAVSALSGNSSWKVLTGRRDGIVSLASEANQNLPSPFSDFNGLFNSFSSKGLNVTDLVVLSGGHTIGVAHCSSFSNRLYNFTGTGDSDPSLDRNYANFLKIICPKSSNNNSTTVFMEPVTPIIFDKKYYNILSQNLGLFTSDAALLTNPQSDSIVQQILQRPNDHFMEIFGESMLKMGSIEVQTGNAGQIRKNCRIINPM